MVKISLDSERVPRESFPKFADLAFDDPFLDPDM